MKKNMGRTDKIIRVIAALLFIVLYATGVVAGWFGILLLVIAAILLITSLIGFCPLYTIFGWSTCKTEPEKGEEKTEPTPNVQ